MVLLSENFLSNFYNVGVGNILKEDREIKNRNPEGEFILVIPGSLRSRCSPPRTTLRPDLSSGEWISTTRIPISSLSSLEKLEGYRALLDHLVTDLEFYVKSYYNIVEDWKITLMDKKEGEVIHKICGEEPFKEQLQIRIDEMLEYGQGDKKILERVQRNLNS